MSITQEKVSLSQPLTQPRVQWYVSVYAKDGDFAIDEHPLAGVNTAALQALFGQEHNDPMFDVYPVTEAQAQPLELYAGQSLDLQKYDYFVECVAE